MPWKSHLAWLLNAMLATCLGVRLPSLPLPQEMFSRELVDAGIENVRHSQALLQTRAESGQILSEAQIHYQGSQEQHKDVIHLKAKATTQSDGDDDDEEDDEDDDEEETQKAKPKTEDEDEDEEEEDEEKQQNEKTTPEQHEEKATPKAKEEDEDDDDEDDEADKAKSTTKDDRTEEKPKEDSKKSDSGEPTEPGCYVFMPDGCPGHIWGANPWKRDYHGEANANAGVDRAACEEQRRIKFNKWCSKDNAKMLFIQAPPQSPSDPGCYYWNPSGCPTQDKKMTLEWARDESGEANQNAGTDQSVCEGKRKRNLDKWCGVDDTKMLFVRKAPEKPEYPGCYVWLPQGCGGHPKFGAQSEWKRDAWGEDNVNAGSVKSECEKRKQGFAKWCGSDTQMLFVPAP